MQEFSQSQPGPTQASDLQSMPRATLPRRRGCIALRVRRRAERPASGPGAFFVVSAALNDLPGQEACARLGLIIAKRFAARASTRNAIKRVIREAFRHRRLALPAKDYVVRLQCKMPPATLTVLKQTVRAEVDAHFERIAR